MTEIFRCYKLAVNKVNFCAVIFRNCKFNRIILYTQPCVVCNRFIIYTTLLTKNSQLYYVVFSVMPTKDLAPFFLYIPTKKPLFSTIKY